jgi:FkbM family methyltransferase
MPRLKERLDRLTHPLGIHLSGWPGDFANDLRAMLARHRITCVIDVGARHGDYGTQLRALGYRGRIVSFEPVPENVALLRARAAGDAEWRVEAMALGREDGELPINVTAGSDLHSFRAPSARGREQFGGAMTVARQERVPVRRLADVLDGCTAGLTAPRVFLKTDTQGFDFEVLAGAGGRLAEIPALQTEIAAQALYEGVDDLPVALGKLAALGYGVVSLSPVVRDSERRVVEFDCLSERRSAP